MQHLSKPHLLFTLALAFALLLAVACGTSAPAEEPAAPSSSGSATASSSSDTVSTAPSTGSDSGTSSGGAAPTAAALVVPTTAAVAAPEASSDVKVNPGKVTVLIGSLGNERFDYAFSRGTGHDMARIVHGFWISSDIKDGSRQLTPGIATNWEVSDDGLTWTLTIREGVKWQDGTELTAEDALWTLQHLMGPQATDYYTGFGLPPIMDRIEQTGPDKVSITTKIPVADFVPTLSDATGVWIGVVMPKRGNLGDEAEALAYDQNPIGSGPMMLVDHVQAQGMTFERFADHYQQPANGFSTDKRMKFTTLHLGLVPEEATRVAAIRAGDADIAPVSLQAREQVEAGGGRLVLGQEGVYTQLLLRGCWGPEIPCADRRVRHALAYAFDKEIIRDRLYSPEVLILKGWSGVTPSTIGYSSELDPFPYDPDKARQLLAEAGYPGGEGFGKLIINTWVSTSSPLMPEAAQLGAEMWKKELGLDVEVRVGEEGALKKAYSYTEDLYGQVLWRDNETRVDAGGILRSGYGTPDRFGRQHNDPELFAQVQEALAVFEPVEREMILNKNYRQMRDEAFNISYGYFNIPWAVGSRIVTWEPYPLAIYISGLHTVTLEE